MKEIGYDVKLAKVYETPNNMAAYGEVNEMETFKVVETFVSINGEGKKAGRLAMLSD